MNKNFIVSLLFTGTLILAYWGSWEPWTVHTVSQDQITWTEDSDAVCSNTGNCVGSEIELNPNTGEIIQSEASSLNQREAIVMEYSTVVRQKNIESTWYKDLGQNYYYWKT